MNYNLSLTLLGLASVLSVTLASRSDKNKIDKVHSEVLSYVYQKMGGIRLMRGNSANLECYNEFIPYINYLATKARDNSKVCVKNAGVLKDQELIALKNHRAEIDIEVLKIRKYYDDCSISVGIDYFNCLDGNADNSIITMESIKVKVAEIQLKYGEKMAEIDRAEQTCLNGTVDKAKSDTDKAFDDLRQCLTNGFLST